MANDEGPNIIRCDTAATIISSTNGPKRVLAMQWVDDVGAAGGIIANTEGLIMRINGVLVQIEVTAVATQLAGGVAWSVEFSQPFIIDSLVVSTIDGGTLIVWCENS